MFAKNTDIKNNSISLQEYNEYGSDFFKKNHLSNMILY